jgi:hypothetical protein
MGRETIGEDLAFASGQAAIWFQSACTTSVDLTDCVKCGVPPFPQQFSALSSTIREKPKRAEIAAWSCD